MKKNIKNIMLAGDVALYAATAVTMTKKMAASYVLLPISITSIILDGFSIWKRRSYMKSYIKNMRRTQWGK